MLAFGKHFILHLHYGIIAQGGKLKSPGLAHKYYTWLEVLANDKYHGMVTEGGRLSTIDLLISVACT
jgi:hypothetical protein